MRERQFVEQNKDKWERFEAFADGRIQASPEELSELYARITDDLSYARTYYGRRSIRVYLNNLAQKVYLSLHKQRSDSAHPFVHFWTHDLPFALFRARKELNISLLFFLLSMAIGVLSSIHDPDFPAVILGEDYVTMTEENIIKGEPMGVYKQSEEIDMFLAITLNNLLVAFRTFVLGAFFGVGTLIIMLYNGIMVGTFQYFFIERSLFTESFLTIWMHGALEISAIVIAGGAGLTLGRGLLFPGTLPRLQSFQIAARRSLKIMLGLVPIFIAAAFIEGFFTRITELPDGIRAGFIFTCFAFVGLYFWFIPRRLFRGSDADQIKKEELITPLNTALELPLIRKTKEVFTASFVLYRTHFAGILGTALGAALLYTLAFKLIYGSEGIDNINFTRMAPFNLYQFHRYGTFYWNFFLNIMIISSVLWFALRAFRKKFGNEVGTGFASGWRLLLKVAVIATIFELFILSGNALVASLGILFIPFLTLFLVVAAAENLRLPDAFSRMVYLLNGTRRHPFMIFLMLGLISMMMLFLLDSPFTWFYLDVLQWNMDADDEQKIELALLSLLFVNQFGLAMVLPLTLYGQLMEYYGARESRDAAELEKAVDAIGIKRSAYGLDRE
jgi:uncharacterized membrane protein SpoIIM required for sporulation